MILTFGKHRGQDITWVLKYDIEYLEWLARQREMDRPGLVRYVNDCLDDYWQWDTDPCDLIPWVLAPLT